VISLKKYFVHKPHILLWGLTSIFLGYYIYYGFYYSDSTLDINIHDTYIVIAHAHFFNLLVTWFGLCGLGYWILYRYKVKLINWLTSIHIGFTILLSVIIFFPNLFTIVDNKFDKNVFPITMYILDTGMVMVTALFFIILIQPIYFLNICIATIKSIRNK